MDVCEKSIKKNTGRAAVDIIRRPLIPADKNNNNVTATTTNTTTRRSRTREVSSRYLSPSSTRRCASPNFTRTQNSSHQLFSSSTSKRAVSAERRRPSTPPSPTTNRPSTPVRDTSAADSQLASKKVTTGGGAGSSSRLPECLWPSTMRSLSVSFQSDSISIPVSKKKEKEKEKLVALSDRTLKPSSNVASKQHSTEAAVVPRKPTPERKRSPLKGKTVSDQLENSRPVDGSQTRLIDQHRWPSRAGGGRLASGVMTKSVDLSIEQASKASTTPFPSIGMPNLRRLSSEGIPKPLHKSSSDAAGQSLMDDIGGVPVLDMDDTLLKLSALEKTTSLGPSEKAALMNPAAKCHSLPGSRLPSPIRTSVPRGMPSPSRSRPSTPNSSRGLSPSRIRPASPTRHASTTTSVLSFIADIKKAKKGANQLEDAHQLKLLYNRNLQWRFANARADDALHVQHIMAEKMLYNVWRATLELWDSVIMKRTVLQQLQLELKLNLVLNEQLGYLEDWSSLERDHSPSLAGVIKSLEASTLRLPVTGGAKADINSLKASISSAVDVMQAIGSSIRSVLSKVEGTNCLVSEVAELAAQEKALLDECEALMANSAALQVNEYSLRSQLIQQQKDSTKNGQVQ